MDAATLNNPHQRDRRRRARWRVQWPVVFLGEGAVVEASTQDLSSDGFYCLVDRPFVPGEVRFCMLSVPANDPNDLTRTTPLYCRVRVVRVDSDRGLFGIACRIEDYQMQAPPADPDGGGRIDRFPVGHINSTI